MKPNSTTLRLHKTRRLSRWEILALETAITQMLVRWRTGGNDEGADDLSRLLADLNRSDAVTFHFRWED